MLKPGDKERRTKRVKYKCVGCGRVCYKVLAVVRYFDSKLKNKLAIPLTKQEIDDMLKAELKSVEDQWNSKPRKCGGCLAKE